ncbi:MAG: hypothetical protein HN929_06240 [Chloroflexi bacterium]|nr:hypothetical protein [Chloroflexota bacterium]MBT7081049.1 hypothetical protein [Chloroflexota bacterium]
MKSLDKIAPEQFIHGVNECSIPMSRNTDAFSAVDTDARVGLLYEPPLTYVLSKMEICGWRLGDYVAMPQLCIRTDYDSAPSRIALKQGKIARHPRVIDWHRVDVGPIVLVARQKYWLVARAISLNIIKEAKDGQNIPVMVEQPDGKWIQMENQSEPSFRPILRFYGRILPMDKVGF